MAQTQSSPKLLRTKLYAPPRRPTFVARERLLAKLQRGRSCKLSLISAPAGFGKTSLVVDWIAEANAPVAWVSLDSRDNDPKRFLRYVVAGLQSCEGGLGADALALLEAPGATLDTALTALLNDLESCDTALTLVLDDYHVLENPDIDSALTFLLEHLPPQVHLLLTTREDPQLPLARLRARGQLNEIRAADLAFTTSETASFLTQAMGLTLSQQELATLEARTEGWIAGLQLAALSMQGRQDLQGFIQDFAGDHRYIVDYLLAEVLDIQPKQRKDFLLQSAVLNSMNGALCDAVTGRQDSHVQLRRLEQENLFVIPLDDKREWFRYHHLFADVLRLHAKKEQPQAYRQWHHRASVWHAEHGTTADAIHHALAAEDIEGVAALAEQAWPAMDAQFQAPTWLRWVTPIPRSVLKQRPVLEMGVVWALFNEGRFAEGLAHIQSVEHAITAIEEDPTTRENAPYTIIDEEQFQYLPASLATAKGYHAQAFGRDEETVRYTKQALILLPPHDHTRRGPAAALLGLTHWANGDLEEAHQALAEAMENFQRAEKWHFALSGTYGLADIRLLQGRLRDAEAHYTKALRLAEERGEPMLRGTADLYLGLGDIAREKGQLDEAEALLQRSEALSAKAALADWSPRFHLAQARLSIAQRAFDQALAQLEEAERVFIRTPVPQVRPLAAWKARVWTQQGDITRALSWEQERQLSPDHPPHFLAEFEHITMLHTRLAAFAQQQDTKLLDEALTLADMLHQAATQGGRDGHLMDILLVQSRLYHAQGRDDQAHNALQHALALAAPEGYIQIFLDAGPELQHLLSQFTPDGPTQQAHLHRLQQYSDAQPQAAQPTSQASHLNPSPVAKTQRLVESLSPRELEVLQLIAEGHSNAEIGRRLFVTLSTVKGHNRNIFGKLGVRRRTEAVAKARAQGLVS